MATYEAVLRRLIERHGVTQTHLAGVLGVSRQSINKMLKGPVPGGQKTIPHTRLQRLAQDYPEEAAEILSLPSEDQNLTKRKQIREEQSPVLREDAELDTICIFSWVRDEAGVLIKRAVGYKKRPPVLEGVRDAYAFYVPDESMTPCYHQGWIVYVNPHRPVPDDRDAVVFPAGGRCPMIRRIRAKPRGKRVAETLSTKAAAIAESDLTELHLIVSADHEG